MSTIDEGVVVENVPQDSLYGTNNQTLLFTTEYGTAYSYSGELLYSDGKYNSSLTNYGEPFYGTNSSHVVVNITAYSESWSGEYTIWSFTGCYGINWNQECDFSSAYRQLTCDVIDYWPIMVSVVEVSISTLGENSIIIIYAVMPVCYE